MISIPGILKDCRFIILHKMKKNPFENEWQLENNYSINDPKLISALKKGYNYGVMPSGNVCIIDADEPVILKELGVLDPFDDTFTVKSGGGEKYHFYFETDERIGNKKKVLFHPETGEHLGEIYAPGCPAYCVGVNSVHPSGKPYSIFKDLPLKVIPSKDINKLLTKCTKQEKPKEKNSTQEPSQVKGLGFSDGLIIQEAERIFKDEFNRLLSGSSETQGGDDSRADYRFCSILSKFCDNHYQVADLLMKYRHREEFDTNFKYKVQETASNAWNDNDERYNPKSGRLEPLPSVSAIPDDAPGIKDRDDTPLSITRLNLTDIGNASRFKALYGDRFRYDFTQKSWYYWNDEIWLVDNNGCAKKAAQYTIAKMAEEIEVLYKQGDKDHADMVFKHMRKSASEKDRNNMLNTVAPYLSVTPGTWNSKPELLNLQNGTLNLETLKLQGFHQEDYLTFKGGVKYDPGAKCPEWLEHLNLVFGNDADLISAFQLMAGYSLLSGNPSQVFFIPYGSGKNGKSVTINTLRMIMGDYGIHIAPQSLMIQKNEKIRSDLVRIRYKRFVTSSEGEQGAKLDIGWIKQISGGEPIVAAEKYKNEVEFKVEAVIWFATNHKPIINEYNEAIWRRIWLIPFNQVIPEDKRIVDYDKKLIESEGSGILNWMIEGLNQYYSEGHLIKPKAITDAIEEYKEEEDPLGEFIETRCVIENDGYVTSNQIYTAYCEWCFNHGIKFYLGRKPFFNNLIDHSTTEHPIGSKKTKYARVFTGIRLKTDSEIIEYNVIESKKTSSDIIKYIKAEEEKEKKMKEEKEKTELKTE